MTATCETCRFAHRLRDNNRLRECRRYPPQLVEMEINGEIIADAGAFPVGSLVAWCGEHHPITERAGA